MVATKKSYIIEFSDEIQMDIDSLSERTALTPEYILHAAVESYVKNQSLWLDDMNHAVSQAVEGQTVSGTAVFAWMESWGSDKEEPKPALKRG